MEPLNNNQKTTIIIIGIFLLFFLSWIIIYENSKPYEMPYDKCQSKCYSSFTTQQPNEMNICYDNCNKLIVETSCIRVD